MVDFLDFHGTLLKKSRHPLPVFPKELCANPGKSSINGKKEDENSKENSTLPAVLKRVMWIQKLLVLNGWEISNSI